MTCEISKKSTEKQSVNMSKNWKPQFTIGRSVFHEIISWWKFWRTPKKFLVVLDRASKCLELKGEKGKDLDLNIWSPEEEERFVAKLISKFKAEQKMISTTHFIIICFLFLVVIVLQILLMRGVRLV